MGTAMSVGGCLRLGVEMRLHLPIVFCFLLGLRWTVPLALSVRMFFSMKWLCFVRAGVGGTSFASILRSIWYKLQHADHNLKTQMVHSLIPLFIWPGPERHTVFFGV